MCGTEGLVGGIPDSIELRGKVSRVKPGGRCLCTAKPLVFSLCFKGVIVP